MGNCCCGLDTTVRRPSKSPETPAVRPHDYPTAVQVVGGRTVWTSPEEAAARCHISEIPKEDIMGEIMLKKKKPSTVGEMNLKSIQRLDPCAVAIIDKSAHAALYEFDKRKAAWVKTAIEGPLFLYKRADKPLYSLMIANRQSLEDHIEPVIPPLRFSLDVPYVFMNNEDGEIRGFWFFDEEDCTRFYNLLVRLGTGRSPLLSISSDEDLKQTARIRGTQNGCSTNAIATTSRGNCCKTGSEMPALLQKLLSKETAAKLPDVPTAGAVSADQIEKQFLCGDADDDSTTLSTESVKSTLTVIRKHASSCEGEDENSRLSDLTMGMSHNAIEQSASLKKAVVKSQPSSKDKKGREGLLQDNNSPVAPLTKEQFLVALKHMLKDDGFVTRLHCAYLDSINTRLGLRE